MQRTFPLTDFASVSAIIAQLRIFGGTTDAQLATILQRVEMWTLAPGEVVFRKGDEPLHIYVVKSGGIDIQLARDAALLRKHELQIGECFGEASLMSMHRHTATAVAATGSELLVLSRKCLIGLKHEDCALFALLMMNLARELARRLYLTDEMLLAATAKNAAATAAP